MKVHADPTKEFFMTMLTRDISLTSAILDLVDNSVDAAKRESALDQIHISLSLNEMEFKITDNCGGMEKKIAENYAFRFGRDPSAPSTANSVGRFGVGMKRAFFKLGNTINLKSKCNDDSFEIDIDANEWKQTQEWEFDLEDKNVGLKADGTSILVTSLHETVSLDFGDSSYIDELIEFIADAHHKAISDGITITVNGKVVPDRDLEFKQSDELGVIGIEKNIHGVDVKIISGVGERDLKAGGWSIFCNNRLIEGANKSQTTGWGTQGLRAYHPDMAFFRGIVEFNSENGELLPWNTTKNGIDTDNPIYKSVLIEMIRQTKIIAKFLTDRAKEKEAFDRETIEAKPINDSIENAPKLSAFTANYTSHFIRVEAEALPKNNNKRISYNVNKSQLEIAKDLISVSTAAEVGRYTFDYFMENES
ncbi:ATP-binding protein [Psychrobium sp. MM17-31]|uniref:ATP-binding protein n=1 Tax=Psychrobium sp. MM17-31 TaxID=2917758 RepID=UPI001EF6339F|nr:ATP-binding protein [Psychrobium sp. MM17-31]MCG7532634.1 ATP-binding protein [Psychrobium sp. MM17-31]